MLDIGLTFHAQFRCYLLAVPTDFHWTIVTILQPLGSDVSSVSGVFNGDSLRSVQ